MQKSNDSADDSVRQGQNQEKEKIPITELQFLFEKITRRKKLSSISARTCWRPQYAKVGQEASLIRKSTFGVLQGSVQGSMLFNVKDWQKFVQPGKTIFADHTKFIEKMPSNDDSSGQPNS